MFIKLTKEFTTWMNSLKDVKTKAIIASRISRLEDGLKGDIKPVGGAISELRIHYGKGFRIYIKQQGNELIILLCGGNKKTQKKDIIKAKNIAEQLEK